MGFREQIIYKGPIPIPQSKIVLAKADIPETEEVMPAYSFKRRFVDPIKAGLGTYEPILGLSPAVVRPKRQTIRAVGKRRHARPGEIVQLYVGMRTRQCTKIGEGRCISVDPIEIDVRDHQIPIRVWGDWIKDGMIHDFARADGFDSSEDMLEFWKAEHGIGNFRGVLIRWEPVK